jgi:outer membrane protein OmpA-like peptidoglycan-associated protein
MKFYLTLLMVGFLFVLNAQHPATTNRHSVAHQNQKVSIYNETTINSKAYDFSPAFFGDTLVFLSSKHAGPRDPRTGQSFFDFYYSPIGPNGSLRSPKPFSLNLNSAAHEGPASFDLSENKVYFTRNSSQSGVDLSADAGVVRMKIFEATSGLLDWEQVSPLSFNSDAYNCMHPALSEDGNFMVFSSNRPGGKGGYDLYVSRRMDGRWSTPMNLGGRINTTGNEFFPFFHQSGTLFFASNGYKGYGGIDLYMVQGKGDGSWAEAVNLGEPFNSEADDFGLIMDQEGKQGYFTSSREGGVGGDDIYSFDAPDGIQGVVFPDYKTTIIQVFSEQSDSPVSGAEIKIYERIIDSNGEIGYNRLPRTSVQMGIDGKAEIDQRSEDLEEPDEVSNREGKAYIMLDVSKAYKIKVEKRGFFPAEEFHIPADNRFNKPVEVPMRRDDCITLEGVVKDASTGDPVPGVTIFIFNQEEKRRRTLSTDERGIFKECLPDGYRFTIEARRIGYQEAETQVQTINRRGNRSLGTSIELVPDPTTPRSSQQEAPPSPSGSQAEVPSLDRRSDMKVGNRFVLNSLQFEFASAKLQEAAATDLDHLATLMKANSRMKVELSAFTDCIGGEEYNRRLSLKRAEAARDFLARRGVNADRILVFGYGESNPIVDCDCEGKGGGGVPCTEEMHAKNRRTEVAITQK